MAEAVFWFSLAFVLYAYFGYPVVLLLWRSLAPRPVQKVPIEPYVTLIVAAFNEKANIRQKILNCLSLDYPREKLQIIISLDGPTDGTEVLALTFATHGIQLAYTPEHIGKAAALNNAVSKARGSLLVFADARQILDRNVIRELAANFSDPSVGAASGELVLAGGDSGESGGVGLYWRYETLIRSLESEIHSVVGATGALYAIRRTLYRELPADTLLDDVVIPMGVVLNGQRVVLDRTARAFDQTALPGKEFGRKVRTLTGNFQMLARMPQLLNPRRNPVFFQFVSHKVTRLLVPYLLVALFVSNLFLLRGGYLIFLGLQVLWYGLAVAGFIAALGWRSGPGSAADHKVEERI
jgi:cellulose synthase/poly-beta-1,6-N-acetylglucosamine synthase-like glycosyltransferase